MTIEMNMNLTKENIYNGQKHIKYSTRNFNPNFPDLLSSSLRDEFEYRIYDSNMDQSCKFELEFSSPNKSIEIKILSIFNRNNSNLNIHDCVRTFLQESIIEICKNGKIVYEIIRTEDNKIVDFEIVNISNYNLEIRKNNIIQKIPKEANPNISTNLIPRNKCFVFEYSKKDFNNF